MKIEESIHCEENYYINQLNIENYIKYYDCVNINDSMDIKGLMKLVKIKFINTGDSRQNLKI